MKTLGFTLAALLLSTACVGTEEENTDFDQAALEQYRRALPTRSQLEAPRNTPTTATALGQPAIYPHASAEVIIGINGAVVATVETLEFITSLPPTFYDSSTSEFVWGPWQDDDYGYVAAYIKDTQGTGDFRYEYAFVRGATQDLSTMVPIIYGGATPDENNEDHGAGVTVWDMGAAREFAQQNDPQFSADEHSTGRFAALFAAGMDEENPQNEVAVVVAAFRDFIPEGGADAPIDLDYLYGHVNAPLNTVDFVDFQANVDVSDPLDGIAEDVGIRMAFLDAGVGRAEADAINGTMTGNERVDVVECWDTSLNQTYIHATLHDGGNAQVAYTEGTSDSCGAFGPTLDDLGVPRLEDVDSELLAALDAVATNGL